MGDLLDVLDPIEAEIQTFEIGEMVHASHVRDEVII